MADGSVISWTDATWNPTRGCRRVSPGCEHCYAERQANRFKGPGKAYEGLVKLVSGKPRWTGATHFAVEQLSHPLSWRSPRRIFVDSMSDLFYEDFSNEQIAAVFGVMAACPQHTFQILTKRPARMREWFEWMNNALPTKTLGYDPRALACWDFTKIAAPHFASSAWDSDFMSRGHLVPWPLPNVWLGVSVENQAAAFERIPELLATPAVIRFLSCEPLLGPVDLSQWLGANDVEQDQEGRGVRVFSGDRVRAGDRRPGTDLAHREPSWNEERRDDVDPVQTEAGRSIGREGLSECASDGRREADDRAVASPGLAALQGSDTGRSHGEPQERREVRQPAREPRSRDGRGAADSREQGAGHGVGCEPIGGAQSVREGHDDAGARDSGCASDGRDLRGDRGQVRDHVSAGLADRARSQSLNWIIAGCESGPGARPCSVEWLRSLRDQCGAAGVPLFLKQATAVTGGAIVDGIPVLTHAVQDGDGSKIKGGGVIELPYLDGKQHAAFPTVTP